MTCSRNINRQADHKSGAVPDNLCQIRKSVNHGASAVTLLRQGGFRERVLVQYSVEESGLTDIHVVHH